MVSRSVALIRSALVAVGANSGPTPCWCLDVGVFGHLGAYRRTYRGGRNAPAPGIGKP